MTDIVERLREWPHGHKTMIVSEAINEIERLRRESHYRLDTVCETNERLLAAQDEIERLREALMPFAHYFDLNDCDERRDDDALEVPIGDLRRACTALTSTESKSIGNIEGGA